MYQTNKVWGDWGLLQVHTEYTPFLGGWISMQGTHLSSSGNGMKIIYCDYLYEWQTFSGQTLYQSLSRQYFDSAITSAQLPEASWNNVNSNVGTTPARLLVVASIQFQDANNSEITATKYYTLSTSITNLSAPDQIYANVPDYAPIPMGALIIATCGWDFNGSNTRYEAQFSSPNGQIIVSCPPQTSTTFHANATHCSDSGGNMKWRARAINDQGVGPWSEWCHFLTYLYSPITGFINASLDSLPTKPIHKITGTYTCSSGHVITNYSWTLQKYINGSWQPCSSSSSAIFSASLSDSIEQINYRLELIVSGTKNGVVYQTFTSTNLSYVGEGIQQ